MKPQFNLFNLALISSLLSLFYSTVIFVTGPRYTYFLLYPGLFQLLLVTILFFLLFLITFLITKEFRRQIFFYSCGGIFCSYYLVWGLQYSRFTSRSWASTGVVHGVIILLLFVLAVKTMKYVFVTGPASPRKLIVLGVFILIALRVSFFFLPVEWVSNVIYVQKPDRKSSSTLGNLLYPDSISIAEIYKIMPSTKPEIPGGKKISVFTMDAFRQQYFGHSLNGIQLTPNMRQASKKYFYSPNYRVQSGKSKGSVASFFTGLYVKEHGTYHFSLKNEKTRESTDITSDDYYGHALPEKFRTLSERLKEQDFKNLGIVANYHITKQYQYDQGFDSYISARFKGIRQDLFILRSMAFWLAKKRPKNTFIYLHFTGGHYPYLQGRRNSQFWKKTPYYSDGTIAFNDWELESLNVLHQGKKSIETLQDHTKEIKFMRYLYGSTLNYYDLYVYPRFTEILQKLEIQEDSFRIFTSDHGENLFDYQGYYGHGKTLTDAEINVPLLVKMPETFQVSNGKPTISDREHLESIDLTATLLEYGGASRENVSGHSFLAGLKGDTFTGNNFQYSFSELPSLPKIYKRSITTGQKKYVYNYDLGSGVSYRLDHGMDLDVPSDTSYEDPLKTKLFETMGSAATIADTDAELVNIPQEQVKKLKGLGYLGDS